MPNQVTAPTSEALAPIVSRVTRRLIPVLLLMYILAFLDRANLGFAKAAFQADTGLSDAAYALGAGIFFLGYAALEVPSNILMRKLGAKIWLARIMISWGIVSALMMFAQTEWTFYILRVLLGITEAGFFPGVILYLTYWIPTQFRGRVNGLFYFGAPLAFIFGGPLSGMLLDLDGLGGLQGWQLMFLVTGALTVAVGIWAFSYLDNGPADAKWLDDSERTTLVAALDAEDQVKADHSPKGALHALTNPKVLYFCLIYFTIQMSVYGVTFYLPTQIAKLVGAKVGLGVGLMTAVPWGIAIIATFLLSRLADKTGKRRLVATASLAAASLGIFASALTDNPAMGLAALSLGAAGFISVQPVFWTLPTGMLVGAAAAGGIALINSIGSLGGFVAPIAKTWAEASFGPNAGLFLLAITAFLGAVLLFNSHRVSKITDGTPLAQPIAEKVH
ncbi:MFS family permease [Arthrobacter sp. V4I6]|uniref:MFS transporter n=1 Tax=unclassified Arthrobacter TaxID=235627 RepID=UPI00278602A1|nr:MULTISPECIES: MFS transporter [unclassified Arthrobacter]MDQ0819614.1 MFS family permease [Arthrobacter sp. V1I7]MDQ0853794.1 MFS family permease [Arthrobacter sp. V4I6]